EEFAGMLLNYKRVLDTWPASQSFFYPNGTPPMRGEIVKMSPLAKTLRELVAAEKKAKGKRDAKIQAVRDLFYRGSIAKRVAAFSESHGGLITYDDMANFKSDESAPAIGTYRGYTIVKPGFW